MFKSSSGLTSRRKLLQAGATALPVSAIMLAELTETSCSVTSTTNLSTLLAGITAALDVALPVLGVTGVLPAPLVPTIENYLTAIEDSVAKIAPIIADMALNAGQKTAQIASIIAALPAAGSLPNLPPNVQLLIAGIAGSIKAFFTAVQTVGGTLPGAAVAAHVVHPLKTSMEKPSRTERSVLSAIGKQADEEKTKIKAAFAK